MRILVLGPWPLGKEQFGGQIRANAFVDCYKSHGHIVRFVGLSTVENGCDISIARDVQWFSENEKYNSRCSFWRGLGQSYKMLSRYKKLIENFKPEVIQFEEPYLWSVIQTAIDCIGFDELFPKPLIIFSAYNVEHQMIHDHQKSLGRINYFEVAEIEQLEVQAALSADVIFAVSDSDATFFSSICAKKCVVVRNGSHGFLRPNATTDRRSFLQPYALFVSSSHGPNIAGFEDYLALRRSTGDYGKLVVAGTIGNALQTQGIKYDSNIDVYGYVSDEMLATLYAEARLVILPKTNGGGSNLKTADALVSDNAVLGTPEAFRGFEPFIGESGITIRSISEAFSSSIMEHLDAKVRKSYDRICPEFLRWPAAIQPAVDVIHQLKSVQKI